MTIFMVSFREKLWGGGKNTDPLGKWRFYTDNLNQELLNDF